MSFEGVIYARMRCAQVSVLTDTVNKLEADLATAREWGRAASDSNKALRAKIVMLEADQIKHITRRLDAQRELNLYKLGCEMDNT